MNGDIDRDKLPGGSDELRRSNGMARRHLVKSALATPVVLSSLASKPVLGETLYQCTVSGQVSGNLSRDANEALCRIGNTPTYWRDTTFAWPSPFLKGTAPSPNNCLFNGQLVRGTNFNGFSQPGTPVLLSPFYNLPIGTGQSQSCAVVAPAVANNNPSTMYQVLAQAAAPAGLAADQWELAQVVVASLLNSYQFAPNYGVTASAIIHMFNSTYGGGLFAVNGTVSWNRAQVIEYLKKLY
jgi:hypothetical protein